MSFWEVCLNIICSITWSALWTSVQELFMYIDTEYLPWVRHSANYGNTKEIQGRHGSFYYKMCICKLSHLIVKDKPKVSLSALMEVRENTATHSFHSTLILRSTCRWCSFSSKDCRIFSLSPLFWIFTKICLMMVYFLWFVWILKEFEHSGNFCPLV